MEVKPRSLEITVISAEGLRVPSSRPFKKGHAFVTVRSDPSKSISTGVDQDCGGTCPTWNEKLHLALSPIVRSIEVEAHWKTGLGSGTKLIGLAKIPVSDIFEGYVPAHHLQFLSYRLREQDGKRNGIVNLSVRMVAPIATDDP